MPRWRSASPMATPMTSRPGRREVSPTSSAPTCSPASTRSSACCSLIVLSTGSVINGLFGLLIVANSAIGIIQELRAKQTLDKLAIVGQAKPLVRRQSGTVALSPNEVVLDDVIELGPGDQIVVDGEVLEETNLEVDESLLTGEADPIDKDAGDRIMSGSFVVAGSGAYRATKVGREAYAAQAGRGGQQVHPGEVRIAQRHQQDPAGHHLPAGPRRPAHHLHPAVHHRRGLARVGAADGRRAGADGARGSGAHDVDRVRRRRGPAGSAPVPGAGTARHRGARPRRRGLRRQDGHADRERHAGKRSARPLTAADVGNVLAQLAADDPRPNASMAAIGEAYKMPPGWTATANAPFKSATKWSGSFLRRARQLGDRRAGRAARSRPRPMPRKPSGSARRGCGYCCSDRPTGPSTRPTHPGWSPRSRWWCSSSGSAPMPATRWITLRRKRSRSR